MILFLMTAMYIHSQYHSHNQFIKTTVCRTQNVMLGNRKIKEGFLPEHYNTHRETVEYIVIDLLCAEDM